MKIFYRKILLKWISFTESLFEGIFFTEKYCIGDQKVKKLKFREKTEENFSALIGTLYNIHVTCLN
jgi:hypothetical protein